MISRHTDPPVFTGPCAAAQREQYHHPRTTQAMLRHADGRTFQELCDLVGRTAQVRFGDYGCSGERTSWTERVTITEFWGSTSLELFDETSETFRYITVPQFSASTYNGGAAMVTLGALQDIQPPDRVSRRCWACRQDPDSHTDGCPEVASDQAAAIGMWWQGHREYYERRDWGPPIDPSNSHPAYRLGFESARWEWFQTH